MHSIGFTGTQKGMTTEQKITFANLISAYIPTEFNHGDCIGADADAHKLVRTRSPRTKIVGHPPTNTSKQANCVFDYSWTPLDYMARNMNIVRQSNLLIATPAEYQEQLRSGTWSTVRKARSLKVPVIIIYPNGQTEKAT